MEKISVLMSTYREPIDWVKESVESILRQTYSDLEFVIIIDAPDNKELVDCVTEYSYKDDRIKLVKNKENIGLVASLNKGLNFCTGEYIARMDADDISHDDRFEKQIAYLKQMNYDLIGADYNVFFDGNIQRTAKGPYTNEVCKKVLRYESCIAHPSWLAKKTVFDKLGGYRFIDSCEDYDFLIRAALSEFKLGNAPYVLLEYRNNPNSVTHLNAKKQQAITNLLNVNMQKKRIVSMDEYNHYMNSNKRKRFEVNEEKVMNLVDIYKDKSRNPVIRFVSLILLLSTRRYRYMKRVRFYVRKWKRDEKY